MTKYIIMKHLTFILLCLFAGTEATMACMNNMPQVKGNAVILNGVYGEEVIYLCPVEGEEQDSYDCVTPYIQVEDTKYFFSGSMAWEMEITGMKLHAGDEIEVEGVLFNWECTDYIDLIRINNLKAKEESLETVSTELDMQQSMHNILGLPVDDSYHGIVIQNGHKMLRR